MNTHTSTENLYQSMQPIQENFNNSLDAVKRVHSIDSCLNEEQIRGCVSGTQGQAMSDLELQRVYWHNQLRGAPVVLALPTDRPRPAIQSYHAATLPIALPDALRTSLIALSRQQGIPLFVLVLAAFQTLLARYSNQQDISVGTPVAGRTPAELDGTSITRMQMLVLRTDLSDDPTFRTLLGRVREVCQQAYAHQDFPFEQLVAELQPERSLSFNPLFQVVFSLYDSSLTLMPHGELPSARYHVDGGVANGDIALRMTNQAQGLRGVISYNSDLFEPATIVRMANHFQTLLEGIVAHPEYRVSQLPFLTSTERHRLLTAWNATVAAFPAHQCLHALFAEQVACTPDAVAVLFDDPATPSTHVQVTYSELDARANQVAHLVRSLGVGPDVRVALCIERSIAALVGLMGTLKAGGVYVPVEPSYPVERQAFMINDARAAVVLTTRAHRARIAALFEANEAWCGQSLPAVICLDAAWDELATYPTSSFAVSTTPDHLAYVIYTSGSTGTPKGVQVPHRGIVNQIIARQVRCALTADDSLLHHMPSAFDPSVWELCAALVIGARLVIARPGGPIDPTYLAHLIAEQHISILQLVPSVLNMLVEEPAFVSCQALRAVLCGGEALTAELRARTQACLAAEIHHLYGPTETSIDATGWHCPPHAVQEGIAPIGYPIANSVVYILDGHMQPVPIGIPGEVYIGGVGIARGYHARPDLTAERFVPNPFIETAIAQAHTLPSITRLYRTGDLARYLPNGAIMFLGRIDQQVKVRGYRIELGEIEATLLHYPAISSATVIVREDRPGDRRLVAYVVLKEEGVVADEFSDAPHGGFDVAEVRSFLKERLPSYMVPSAIVPLDALPLTPHGKLHYRALPIPEASASTQPFVAPRTALEIGVAEIWATLLGEKHVGLHDNFFDLGGHSLLVTQLILRVREIFHVLLPLRILFDCPTVASFAQAIETMRQSPTAHRDAVLDLHAEATLDATIVPAGPSVGLLDDPATVFVTGASGFLGAFLLYELLEQTQATMYCLVRAANVSEGQRRLRHNLEHYGLWNDAYAERLIPVIGDLTQPLLGLTPEYFQTLASTLDVIYHNGAIVNFLYPYAALKPANVLGTQEILRLACMRKTKPVHYVSTLSIFPAEHCTSDTLIHESDDPTESDGLYSGYAQSKWVADRLVQIARDRGLPTCIYRPAAVTGHSQTGAAQFDDFESRLIKGCIQLGCARDYECQMYFTPVDYVSKAIVFLSRQSASVGRAFHLINQRPMRWPDLIAWVRAFGYPMRLCSFDAWCDALNHSVQHSQENALYPFAPMFFDEHMLAIVRANRHRFLQFDSSSTIATLAAAGIACPPVDSQLLHACFAYFIRSGFLTPPPETSTRQESKKWRIDEALLQTDARSLSLKYFPNGRKRARAQGPRYRPLPLPMGRQKNARRLRATP